MSNARDKNYEESPSGQLEIKQLEKRVKELKALLKIASCPDCTGDGQYYDSQGNVTQCQFCYERLEILGVFDE